jgi:hypothetical protein
VWLGVDVVGGAFLGASFTFCIHIGLALHASHIVCRDPAFYAVKGGYDTASFFRFIACVLLVPTDCVFVCECVRTYVLLLLFLLRRCIHVWIRACHKPVVGGLHLAHKVCVCV